MQVVSANDFFQHFSETDCFYVGFLKMRGSWVPLCALKDPQESTALDMIYVSRLYDPMAALTSAYAEKVSGVEQTFVQFLMPNEIRNLVDRYGLHFVAQIAEEEGAGCGCGCGCGG
ncbi:hypothetical protein [Desulfosoma caldarium]|uniref:Uncharacterized protein n=1 Tax=Desulfosoma caldarium TaxID=610254 RepID=A0A3N1VQM1_9BACT|nr:hypothetical protein [Desulfosoma caldarium]ROR03371.1 hypothetical protein EDC27_0130 [Desulfosoma caldarium]